MRTLVVRVRPRRDAAQTEAPAGGECHSHSAVFEAAGGAGEFDIATLPSLESQIESAVSSHGGLILDAGDIAFAGSTFPRLLLATHWRCDLHIAAPSPAVHRLLDTVGAEDLPVHSTLAAARTP